LTRIGSLFTGHRWGGSALLRISPHIAGIDFSGAGESRYSLPLSIEYLVHLPEAGKTQVEEEEK